MAKAVFLGAPAHGHVNPTRAVVRELLDRGEKVTYFCGEEFRAKIEACGATFRSYEEGPSDTFSYGAREIGNIFLLAAMLLEKTQAFLPRLLERIREERPDYIIHDAVSIWGKAVAALLDLPAVCSITSLAFTSRAGAQSWDFAREVIRMFLQEGSALWRARRAAARISKQWNLPRQGFVDALTNEEKLNIVYTSEVFQPAAHTFGDSYRFVGPSLFPSAEDDDFPWERLRNAPVVYISMGTIFHEADAVYHACFEALRDVDCAVILSVGAKTDIARLGAVPGNFIVRGHVPQLRVLSRARAFVTHGGMNSVSEALLHGVPLVGIPQGADQFVIADRVHELRAGVRLRRKRITASRVRKAVLEVLENSVYRDNSRRIGDSFRAAGGPQRAAEEIIRFTRMA